MTTNRSAKEIVSEYNTMNQVNEQSKIGTEMETGPVYGSDQVIIHRSVCVCVCVCLCV